MCPLELDAASRGEAIAPASRSQLPGSPGEEAPPSVVARRDGFPLGRREDKADGPDFGDLEKVGGTEIPGIDGAGSQTRYHSGQCEARREPSNRH